MSHDILVVELSIVDSLWSSFDNLPENLTTRAAPHSFTKDDFQKRVIVALSRYRGGGYVIILRRGLLMKSHEKHSNLGKTLKISELCLQISMNPTNAFHFELQSKILGDASLNTRFLESSFSTFFSH